MSRFDSISIRKLSIQFDSRFFFITFSEYSFNTKIIDISKKWTVNKFTNGELIKKNKNHRPVF